MNDGASLVIENSTVSGSLALTRNGTMLLERTFRGAGELATEVASAIGLVDQLDEVIVGIGSRLLHRFAGCDSHRFWVESSHRLPEMGVPLDSWVCRKRLRSRW